MTSFECRYCMNRDSMLKQILLRHKIIFKNSGKEGERVGAILVADGLVPLRVVLIGVCTSIGLHVTVVVLP